MGEAPAGAKPGAPRVREDMAAAKKRSPQDVSARVNLILREGGAPTDRFKNLEPDLDMAQSVQRHRSTLGPDRKRVILAQFSASWSEPRARQKRWRPPGSG